MEYLIYICEIVQDVYDNLYFKYNEFAYAKQSKQINIFNIHEDEINKLIEDVKKEIKIDKEIKNLENRYDVLCKDINKIQDYDDNNNNNNNNDNDNEGAIKINTKRNTKRNRILV